MYCYIFVVYLDLGRRSHIWFPIGTDPHQLHKWFRDWVFLPCFFLVRTKRTTPKPSFPHLVLPAFFFCRNGKVSQQDLKRWVSDSHRYTLESRIQTFGHPPKIWQQQVFGCPKTRNAKEENTTFFFFFLQLVSGFLHHVFATHFAVCLRHCDLTELMEKGGSKRFLSGASGQLFMVSRIVKYTKSGNGLDWPWIVKWWQFEVPYTWIPLILPIRFGNVLEKV